MPPDGVYDRLLAEVERPLISACLEATGGNQLKAARLLGINRNTLRKKLTDLGLDPVAARRL
jgi:two-component system nitrogen regulation response regulator GlnG